MTGARREVESYDHRSSGRLIGLIAVALALALTPTAAVAAISEYERVIKSRSADAHW
jgi:hypothetical protein